MPSEGHQSNTTKTGPDSQEKSRNSQPSADQEASPEWSAQSAGRTTRPYHPKALGMYLHRSAETHYRSMGEPAATDTTDSKNDELRARWLQRFANTGHTRLSGLQPDGRTANPSRYGGTKPASEPTEDTYSTDHGAPVGTTGVEPPEKSADSPSV